MPNFLGAPPHGPHRGAAPGHHCTGADSSRPQHIQRRGTWRATCTASAKCTPQTEKLDAALSRRDRAVIFNFSTKFDLIGPCVQKPLKFGQLVLDKTSRNCGKKSNTSKTNCFRVLVLL